MIYLDNNATTALAPQVFAAMQEELQEAPSNPSSTHSYGQRAKGRLAISKQIIADYFGLKSHLIYFTSSGTEALNWIASALIHSKKRILTSPVEHAALWLPLQDAAKYGAELDLLHVGIKGAWSSEEFYAHCAKKPPEVICCMASNNETGSKFPIEAIASYAYRHKIPFFVDATAWIGKEPFIIYPGITGFVFSPHKFHGPKGVGVLALTEEFALPSLFLGGSQEFGLRAGTENLPAIVGAAKAISLLLRDLESASSHMRRLRDLFEAELIKAIPFVKIIGGEPRICNTSNCCFYPIDGQHLLMCLDLKGVAASYGAACSSASLKPSRVLLDMGIPLNEAKSALRFSFSRYSQESDVHTTIAILKELCLPKKQIER